VRGFEGSPLGKGIHTVRRAPIQETQIYLIGAAKERLCPLLFLLYVNDIWSIIDSSIRLFANTCNVCITYVKHTNKNVKENL
jgi:hypothetical protein